MAGLNPDQLERLFRSGDYSDWRITCQGREWKVHRAIISQASEFFRVSCEKDFKEKEDRVSDFPDDDPDAFEVLLTFVYLGQYSLPPSKPPTTEAVGHATEKEQNDDDDNFADDDHEDVGPRYRLLTKALAEIGIHVKVYLLADKLSMEHLKLAASCRFEKGFTPDLMLLPSFTVLLGLIYKNTTHCDRLRLSITGKCVDSAKDVQTSKPLLDVIEQHEWVAFYLGRDKVECMNTRLKDKIRDLEEQVQKQKSEILRLSNGFAAGRW